MHNSYLSVKEQAHLRLSFKPLAGQKSMAIPDFRPFVISAQTQEQLMCTSKYDQWSA